MTLLTNETLSSLRRAHATSFRRPLLHDDKSIQGQLEWIDLIIESSEHLQAQRDNIFLSDLDILTDNLSYYCRHLLQTVNTTVHNLFGILHDAQTTLEHSSHHDQILPTSPQSCIQALMQSHGLRLESLIFSANPLICEFPHPQWHDTSIHFHFLLLQVNFYISFSERSTSPNKHFAFQNQSSNALWQSSTHQRSHSSSSPYAAFKSTTNPTIRAIPTR